MMGDLISREAAIDIMQAKGDAALGTPKAVCAGYPPHIIVRFDDGSERKYKREG